MAIPVYPPSREGDLLAWAANFFELINATPTQFGLTAPQATAFGALSSDYADKYETATEPSTNSHAAVVAKNTAKAALLAGASQLVAIVQAHPGTTDAQRAALGIKVRDNEPTPAPVPAAPPFLAVVSTLGRTVKLRLGDLDNPNRRAKPPGVQGATILTYVGDFPPDDPMEWAFAINTSRTLVDVQFPLTVAAGAKVWITAVWFNTRKETSIAAEAVSVRLSEGTSQAQAA